MCHILYYLVLNPSTTFQHLRHVKISHMLELWWRLCLLVLNLRKSWQSRRSYSRLWRRGGLPQNVAKGPSTLFSGLGVRHQSPGAVPLDSSWNFVVFGAIHASGDPMCYFTDTKSILWSFFGQPFRDKLVLKKRTQTYI